MYVETLCMEGLMYSRAPKTELSGLTISDDFERLKSELNRLDFGHSTKLDHFGYIKGYTFLCIKRYSFFVPIFVSRFQTFKIV